MEEIPITPCLSCKATKWMKNRSPVSQKVWHYNKAPSLLEGYKRQVKASNLQFFAADRVKSVGLSIKLLNVRFSSLELYGSLSQKGLLSRLTCCDTGNRFLCPIRNIAPYVKPGILSIHSYSDPHKTEFLQKVWS